MARPGFNTALLIALLGIAIPAFIYRDSTRAVIDSAHQWVSKLGIYAYPIWVVLHALFIVLCFPGTFAFEGAAGLLFGVVRGSAAVLAAKTLGAAIAFWLGKTLLRDQVRAYTASYPKFQVVVHGVQRDGWWFVLLARLSPIPSWINNYGLAAVDVRFFPDYIVASCAGTLPFILLNTYAGYLAEQGLSAPDADSTSSWTKYALPGLGFTAAVALFWKLTSYAQQYQATLESAPDSLEPDDTASEVVFLNEDKGVGPAAGLRSRAKKGEEGGFSEGLGAMTSPVTRRSKRKEESQEPLKTEGLLDKVLKPEETLEGVFEMLQTKLKGEPTEEQEMVSPRKRGRPRKSVTSPTPSRTPAKSSLTSPLTSPTRRQSGRLRKVEAL